MDLLKRAFPALLCLLMICSAAAPAALGASPAAQLYVSLNGSDANGDGSQASPFASIQKAKEYLAAQRSAAGSGAEVILRGGTYHLTDTLRFTSDDMPDVTYRSYEGESVTISGASPVSGFTRSTVNGVAAFVKQLTADDPLLGITELSDGNAGLPTPRLPESGFYTVNSINTDDDLYTKETTFFSLTLGQQSFNSALSDVTDFAQPDRVKVRILHYWHDELAYVKGVDTGTGRISLSRPSTLLIREGDRYFYDNVYEALDSPGEWYLDKAALRLWYIPREGETAQELTLYASGLKTLISIDGADGISFRGITFRDTGSDIPVCEDDSSYAKAGMDMPQGAILADGAISVCNCNNFSVTNCDLLDLGEDAVKITGNVGSSSISSCLFKDTGASAIYIGGQNPAQGEEGLTHDITVTNNIIDGYGRQFYCAPGIILTFCDTADISANEIHDGYYSGISCGWVWGYEHNSTKDIAIKDNLIYDIGQGMLSDMGGIYTLGVQPGTVINGNVIHNVICDDTANGYGGQGIYLDEGSSYMTVSDNLVYCCSTSGLNIHYGAENTFRNNISAFNGVSQVSCGTDKEDRPTASFISNIYLTSESTPIYDYMLKDHFSDSSNTMWDITNGAKLYFLEEGEAQEAMTLTRARRSGYLNDVCAADPLFTDAGHFDFTLSDDSPALTKGFTQWDYTISGTKSGTVVGTASAGGGADIAGTSAMIPVSGAKTGTSATYMKYTLYTLAGCAAVLAVMLLVKALMTKRYAFAALLPLFAGFCEVCAWHRRAYIAWKDMTGYGVSLVLIILLSGFFFFMSRQARRGRRAGLKTVIRDILTGCAAAGLPFWLLIFIINNVLLNCTGAKTAVTAGLIYLGALIVLLFALTFVRLKKHSGK